MGRMYKDKTSAKYLRFNRTNEIGDINEILNSKDHEDDDYNAE